MVVYFVQDDKTPTNASFQHQTQTSPWKRVYSEQLSSWFWWNEVTNSVSVDPPNAPNPTPMPGELSDTPNALDQPQVTPDSQLNAPGVGVQTPSQPPSNEQEGGTVQVSWPIVRP